MSHLSSIVLTGHSRRASALAAVHHLYSIERAPSGSGRGLAFPSFRHYCFFGELCGGLQTDLGCWEEREMPRICRLLCILCAMGAISGAAFGADCTSSQGCATCKEIESAAPVCKFVQGDAYCSCTLLLFGGSYGCGVDGECDYQIGGGGGSGGGETGGETCYRLPSQWCPSECSSCETVFWY